MSVELEKKLRNATVRYAGETQDEATIRRNNAIKEAADTLRCYREALEVARNLLLAHDGAQSSAGEAFKVLDVEVDTLMDRGRE